MNEPERPGRSREACPNCGRHALELIYYPTIDVKGIKPYDELIGMGDVRSDSPPGIGCGACGADWPDLAAFRAAARPPS